MKKRLITFLTTTMMITSLLGVTGCGGNSDKLVMDKTDFDLELGEDPSQNYTPYIPSSFDGDITDLRFDFSKVDYNKTGTYEATLTLDKEVEKFNITVVDTVAPEVEIKKDIIVLANSPLKDVDVIDKLEEASANITIEFDDYLGQEKNIMPVVEVIGKTSVSNCTSITYAEKGEYKNGITVTDENGNASHYEFTVLVKENPTITGEDKTVVVGSEEDLLAGITAVDCDGNDISSNIVIDNSTVDFNTPGTYTVTYQVKDINGFPCNATYQVVVNEKKEDVDTNTESKPTENKKPSTSNNSSNSNTNNNEVAQTPQTPSTPEPEQPQESVQETQPETPANIWKYDTAYSYKAARQNYPTWADDTSIYRDEILDAIEGRNKDAAYYLLQAGGYLSIWQYEDLYEN